MIPNQSKALGVCAIFALGCISGWLASSHWHAPPKTAVTYHPMVVQKDGSVVAARAPEANPKAPMSTPKGAVVDSTTHITLKPRKPITDDHSAIPEDCAHLMCPAVSIDLASVHGKDGPDEVVRVDGADVDTATFHPKSTFDQPVDHRHILGATYSSQQHWGAFYQQSSGPVTVGVMAEPGTVRVMAGWRW